MAKHNHFWIVLFYSLGLVISLGVLSYILWDRPDPKIMYVPVPILQWGFVGGVVSVLYRLAFDRSHRPESDALYPWIVAKPVVGIVMGAIVYFIALSGELALNGKTEINNIAFLNILAFLGGFSDRFSLDLLEKIAGRVSKGKSEQESNKGDDPT